MSARRFVVRALLRAYPAPWRDEYGAELDDLLMARPLGVGAIADVICAALYERGRAADAATLMGVIAMLGLSAALAWNIGISGASASGLTSVLGKSSKTFPTIIVKPFLSDFCALLLTTFGCWMHLRHGTKPSHSGRATMKASFIAGLPVLLIGVLTVTHVLDVVAAGTSLRGWEIIAAPLSYLPQAWVLGFVGGKVGQQIARVFADFHKGGSGLLKRSFLPIACVLAAPIMVVGFQSPSTDSKIIQASVETWLSLIDKQSYAASWDEAGSGFRAAVTRDQWQAAVSTARAPFGSMRSRTLKTARSTTALRGALPGQYMVFEFDTTFAQQPHAVETVTVAREQDGSWRVVGYLIK